MGPSVWASKMITHGDEMGFVLGHYWQRSNLEDISEILSADSIPLKKKERKLENSEVLFTSKHLIDPINFGAHLGSPPNRSFL